MSLLEAVPTRDLQATVFRLASYQDNMTFLQDQGFDLERIDEMMEFARSRGIDDSLEDLCDAPFRSRPALHRRGYKTRFSDGSHRVFYGALEPATAEAEVRHWLSKFAGRPHGERTAYYRRLRCEFNGTTKDLRSKKCDWPELTSDSDYSFCNRLGREAADTGLNGLLVPSVRRADGTNLPVFARKAIANPVVEMLVALTYDPAAGTVSTTRG